ncbi:MAG: pre-peptidase C-terminal domain-containing protein [Gemmatimonadota bacterium]
MRTFRLYTASATTAGVAGQSTALRFVPAVFLPLASAAALLLGGCDGPVAPHAQADQAAAPVSSRDKNVGAAATNDFMINALPVAVSVTSGGSGTSVISTAITSGAAETITLSTSGVPAGASASFTSNTITTGTSARLTLNSGTAAAGTYSVIVTGTAASATHSKTISFVINPVVVNDFSIKASPSTVSVTSGGSGTSVISTAVTSGNAQSVTLSASGAPTGATAGFSPNPITAGGGTRLTLSSGSAAVGTYSVTITGTGASATHSTTVSFVINPVVVNDFSISASPISVSVTQGGSGTSIISTAVTSGSAQAISLFASGLPVGATATLSPASISAGGSSTLTLNSGSAAVGTFSVTISGTGASATHSTSIALTVVAGNGNGNALTNGVAITGLSGANGQNTFYTMAVPAGQTSLTFNMSGGTGDADMYIRFGAQPTTSTWDCRPFVNGNTETCAFSNPAAGTWFVMIHGFTAFTGVSIKGTYSGGTNGTPSLDNGLPVTGISGPAGSSQFWRLSVPPGQPRVVFTITGSSSAGSDADLYVRRGSPPLISIWDCRPFITGSNETCTINNPVEGDYYVMLQGFTAYSGVTLIGQYP